MREQILRGICCALLIIMMTSDLHKLMNIINLAKSPTLGPVLAFISQSDLGEKNKVAPGTSQNSPVNNNPIEGNTLVEDNNTADVSSSKSVSPSEFHHHHPQTAINDEETKVQLEAFKAHLTNAMQQWCLPKLVCELHAIMDRSSLSQAEIGLINLIRETSLGSMGEIISRYHFAADMGSLLAGVEGNGCHNLYPNCPLSGNKVLQMVKKVRVK